MVTRMLSSTFGGIDYNSGVIPAGQDVSPSGQTANYTTSKYAASPHDDVFYVFGSGQNHANGKFLTYDTHDLRDFLEEGKCMANAMINIQRMKETPNVISCYNVAPLRNIIETIIVTNANLDLQDGAVSVLNFESIFRAGFSSNLINRNEGKLDDQREILYCERRVYAQDKSQEFTSPDSMGQMAAPPAVVPPGLGTRWINNWILMDRTVTGEADLVIGPNLQVLRFIEVECHERSNQQVSSSDPAAPALEWQYLDSQVYLTFPPFVMNIMGEVRDMTATEKAVEYSNVFLSNQNPPN